jgi:signal transduction histidine kinase
MSESMVLLADFEVVRNMGHRFQGKNAQLHWDDLFMLLAIVLAVVVAGWLLSRVAQRERRRRTNSPRALFQELCQAHRLDRQSRKLLLRLAKHQELSHPASLFIDPRRFAPGQLPELSPSQLRRLENLRVQLFAEEAAEASAQVEGAVHGNADSDATIVSPAASAAP